MEDRNLKYASDFPESPMYMGVWEMIDRRRRIDSQHARTEQEWKDPFVLVLYGRGHGPCWKVMEYSRVGS